VRKYLVTLVLTAALLGPVVAAQAANESIGLSLDARPSAGPLYREVYRPIDASLTVTVTSPDSEATITPLKVANVTFPGDMEFFPNPKKTPACPDSRLGEQTNLAVGVAQITALCPDSVIGTGTSVIQIAKFKSGTVTDPKLVIFNAGRNRAGRPKIKIYGYSKYVNSGMLMQGVLARNGELKIAIGVLPFDSSVSQFKLGIPGEPIEVADTASGKDTSTVKGQDPDYLRGKCSTGTWRASGRFLLGDRAYPGGSATGPESEVSSNSFALPCKRHSGKPRIRIIKITGPRKVLTGGRGKFTVHVTNPGTATAKNVKLAVRGAARGSSRTRALAPGRSRRIQVTVKGERAKGRDRITFRVSAEGRILATSVRNLLVG
jgi:hypothetical protein